MKSISGGKIGIILKLKTGFFMKTALEILKEVIPNYADVDHWHVILYKNGNDTFTPYILKAMEIYAAQRDEEIEEIKIEPTKESGNIFGDDSHNGIEYNI